jgi:hypothetical protein
MTGAEEYDWRAAERAMNAYEHYLVDISGTRVHFMRKPGVGPNPKQHMAVMTPWFSQLFAENQRLLGPDWWPYGVEANRTAVDTFPRYHHEQGLSTRLLTSEDIFVPDLLGT